MSAVADNSNTTVTVEVGLHELGLISLALDRFVPVQGFEEHHLVRAQRRWDKLYRSIHGLIAEVREAHVEVMR